MSETGHVALKGWRRRLARLRLGAARRLEFEPRFEDEGRGYRVRCRALRELWRVHSLFLKETGTIALLRDELRERDVVYDVGANIGLYTLLAAGRVGPSGRVYAFEPMAASFASLVENVARNGLGDRIVPLSLALTDEPLVAPFHYSNLEPATSGSQLHEPVADDERPFEPVVTELKYGTSLDALVESGTIRPPHLVKIDVDGNEYRVLRGMRRLLEGSDRPRVISVELNARGRSEAFALLESCGYRFTGRHETSGGAKRIQQGADPESVPYNAVFRPH